MKKHLDNFGFLETWIFETWKLGKFWKFGKNGFLKNGKNLEHFGSLEKWIFENLKQMEFWKNGF